MASPRFKLDKADLTKVGVGAVIALLGALATYLETTVVDVDFGEFQVLAVAVNSVLVNVVRKLLVTVKS